MSETLGRILVVDDDQGMRELLQEDLGRRGHQVLTAANVSAALEHFQKNPVDVVLTDLNMPGGGGIELCQALHQRAPDLPVLIITAFGSLDTAIAALRAGAHDFVTKPIDLDLLALTLRRALEHCQLRNDLRQLQDEVRRNRREGSLLGDSLAMLEIRDLIARLAELESSILLHGESGTGKELVAKALHDQSSRHTAPFVAINCAALPETLLESELFGHEKGAFTDARTARQGLFLQAAGGTLLLDEIGELPLSLQPKLLRALEERTVRPLGGTREIPFDVRIIAATHRDLGEAIQAGTFREDLYYRLNVIAIDIPPLRERGNDILLLAEVFIAEFARRLDKPVKGLSEAAASRLLSYSWPGNVRELRNLMERAVALSRHPRLGIEDLPAKLQPSAAADQLTNGIINTNNLVSLEEMDQRYIRHVLEAVSGNRSLAAKILGIDRKTLYRKLKEA
ncbi:MAG TPA: sigma-54 dependent transcriptional regulator [Geothermobacteraceae bacterium]|nr:sigma-54 dependent transcriptional regulator [Geothermobacteraceae bacterium]